jgi:hypothetical protein
MKPASKERKCQTVKEGNGDQTQEKSQNFIKFIQNSGASQRRRLKVTFVLVVLFCVQVLAWQMLRTECHAIQTL